MPPVRQGDFEDCSYRTGRGYLSMQSDGTGLFFGGAIVRIYRDRKSTHMVMPHAGLTHSRYWKRPWGDRTISRLARQFILDVGNRT
jgi:hypothetical protein